MKLRQRPPEEEVRAEDGLYRALLTLKTVDECRRFFHDLCTPAELEALGDRWRVVGLLENGLPYRGAFLQMRCLPT